MVDFLIIIMIIIIMIIIMIIMIIIILIMIIIIMIIIIKKAWLDSVTAVKWFSQTNGSVTGRLDLGR